MPRRPPSTAPRRRPSLDFSLTGLLYCGMMMFMGLAAVNTQANLLFGVFGLMIGVLLVAALISRTVLRRLVPKRVMPESAVVGEPIAVGYEFTNTKRFWPSLSVTLSELDGADAFDAQPRAYLLHAAPRMTASVPAELVPRRRGLYVLDRYQLSTSFPFGFIKRAVDRRERDSVLIFPAIAKVDPRLLALCRSADQAGAAMRPRRGGDDEFYGVKEYRPGENPRRIHWRRSARTGVLVTREMTQVSPPKLVLLVDTHVKSRTPEEHARVEKAIAMAASLASHALDAGLMVGLFAWGRPDQSTDARPPSRVPDYETPPAAPADGAATSAPEQWLSVAPNRGKRHRRDLLAYLAQLPLNTARDTQALLDASRGFYATASPVLLTPQDLQVGLAEQSRGSVVVLAVPNPTHQKYFTFETPVDFATCMPPDQEPAKSGDIV
ncbi:MAG: DUF58 domain-containing protein [Phycisphaerae bacterium]|nr:DUF58 domain-containing protein [Tepidisphaeraceae bacterium]